MALWGIVVNLRTVTGPCGVHLTAQIGVLDRAVTPPCGVLTTTGMNDLDRAVTPQGDGVAGRCALQNRVKTYNFLLEVPEDQPANER